MSEGNQSDVPGGDDQGTVDQASIQENRSIGIRQLVEWVGQHPFATGLLAILGIAGFLLSVIGYQIDREEAGETANQISEVEDHLRDISDGVTESWSDKPQFLGAWDQEKAHNVAWPGGLYDPEKYSEVDGGTIESRIPLIERSFFLPLRNQDARILITSLSEGDCSACAVQLSLFVFKKIDRTWYLDQEARNFVRLGQTGSLNLDDGLRHLDVWNLGEGRFGFVIPTDSWSQGDASEGLEVYSFIADELFKVFEGTTRTYFSGLEKAEAQELGYWYENKITIEFDKGKSSFGYNDIIASYSESGRVPTYEIRIPFNGERYDFTSVQSISECLKELDYPNEMEISSCI